MMAGETVVALGQSWPDLAIEESVLAPLGLRIVDGRDRKGSGGFAWAEASGVLLGTALRLDAALLDELPRCRAIVRFGMGYDNIDLNAARERGMTVAIVREYCKNEVAEHAIAAALHLTRGLGHWDRATRAGAWRRERIRLRRLSAISFGVVGFGLIGRWVADRARSLFGRVLVHDPWAARSPSDVEGGFQFVDSLGEMLQLADVLSLHVPLNDATRGLIGAAQLAAMKPDAYLINMSRGGIVDEAALLEAIQAGTIAGAAIDAFVEEPVPADHPFLSEPRMLLSPHIAWLSEEAEVALRESASREVALILSGKQPSNPIVMPGEK
jgi:D-3-phosphoglycerate dehydrogenase